MINEMIKAHLSLVFVRTRTPLLNLCLMFTASLRLTSVSPFKPFINYSFIPIWHGLLDLMLQRRSHRYLVGDAPDAEEYLKTTGAVSDSCRTYENSCWRDCVTQPTFLTREETFDLDLQHTFASSRSFPSLKHTAKWENLYGAPPLLARDPLI
jgi:hypothetical protein